MQLQIISLILCLLVFEKSSAFSCHQFSGNRAKENDALQRALKIKPKLRHVTIHLSRVSEVVRILHEESFQLEVPKWNHPPYLLTQVPSEMADYLLVLNSVNYAFFDTQMKEAWKQGPDSGSTLAASRLSAHWNSITETGFLPHLSSNFLLNTLFSGEKKIVLLKERGLALREAGEFLDKSGGLLSWISSQETRNAYELAMLLEKELPSWRDPYHKRSQLLFGMLVGWFQGRADLPFDAASVDQLTVFADYRVPQTLRAVGILEIDPRWSSLIDSGAPLRRGSRIETELRAASILAGDELIRELNLQGSWGRVTALEVDFLLWSLGRKLQKGIKMPNLILSAPREHRTVTTHY